VRPLSEAGKLFTSLLIILNIGVLTYTVSVISAFVFEGDLKTLLKENQMETELQNLSGHVIVCGYGRLGKILSEDLEKEGKKVLIVERDEKIIEELEENQKLYLHGDADEDNTVLKMNVAKATNLITTFHSDASNIFVVLAARELNPNIRIISRASTEANVSKLKLAGANHIIIPEDIGGSYIASLVSGSEHVAIGKWEH
jgi:voltage-gated potassium channel